jgi:Na+-transporting methylmalonyl-CoA/oxaloacetate decarboxylase gamma subunit
MSGDLIIGLRLGAIGMSVTFVALGLLSLLMVLLLRIFPSESAARGNDRIKGGARADEDEKRREAIAVAVAVGVSLLESGDALVGRDPMLGKLLEK